LEGTKALHGCELNGGLEDGLGVTLRLHTAQLQTILGKPDDAHDNRFLYLRQFKQNGADVTLYIEARFADSRLNYLAVSRADAK
jgi:hypothetical protein